MLFAVEMPDAQALANNGSAFVLATFAMVFATTIATMAYYYRKDTRENQSDYRASLFEIVKQFTERMDKLHLAIEDNTDRLQELEHSLRLRGHEPPIHTDFVSVPADRRSVGRSEISRT